MLLTKNTELDYFISGNKKLSTLNDNQLMANKTIDTEECINSMHFVV